MSGRIFLCGALLFALSGCGTQIIELLPSADTGTVDLGAGRDTGPAQDLGPRDTGFDTGFDGGSDGGFDGGLDVGFDAGIDGGFDAGIDMGTACVCRFVSCRTDPDCAARIGAGSTCGRDSVCARSVGACQTVRDCDPNPGGWSCVTSPDGLTPCP